MQQTPTSKRLGIHLESLLLLIAGLLPDLMTLVQETMFILPISVCAQLLQASCISQQLL